MIRFSCGHCGQTLKVQDGLEGKSVRCPKCANRNTVPAGQTDGHVEAAHEPDDPVSENPLGALAAMAGGTSSLTPTPAPRPIPAPAAPKPLTMAPRMPAPPVPPSHAINEPEPPEEQPEFQSAAAAPVAPDPASLRNVAAPTPPTPAYAKSATGTPPGYIPLAIVSYLLVAFGFLGILGSIFTLIRGLIGIFRSGASGDMLTFQLTGLFTVFGTGLVGSLLVITFALVALGIRDIARNTYGMHRSRS